MLFRLYAIQYICISIIYTLAARESSRVIWKLWTTAAAVEKLREKANVRIAQGKIEKGNQLPGSPLNLQAYNTTNSALLHAVLGTHYKREFVLQRK